MTPVDILNNATRWLVREVLQGEFIPFGFGMAWMRWDRRSMIVMPVPLNMIAAGLRWFYWAMARPPIHKNERRQRPHAHHG